MLCNRLLRAVYYKAFSHAPCQITRRVWSKTMSSQPPCKSVHAARLLNIFPVPTTVNTCPALPAPSNGTRLGCPGNATMFYDTVCQFSCNDGYVGSGSQVRRCQHNGTWSGQDFTCQSMFSKLCDNFANSDSCDLRATFKD